jgi:hypothetical protein
MRSCRAGGIALGALFLLVFVTTGCHPPVVGDLSPNPSPSRTAITITGHGDQATSPSPFHLDAGDYRVLWSAQGNAVFIVSIASVTQSASLVTEVAPLPSSGEVTFKANGGDYHLVLEASTVTWTITFTPT